MQMKYPIANQERERESKFTLSDFLYANEWIVGNMYIEEYPHDASDINDWDYSKAIDWASQNANRWQFIEIMQDIYSLHIEG